MKISAQLDTALLGMNIAGLKEWHRNFAYGVAYHSMSDPRCREIWERVGNVIRRPDGAAR